MKKGFTILLVCIAATGAFAQGQFRFRFTQDFNFQVFTAIIPTGLYTQNFIPGPDGGPERNNGVSQTILDRGYLFPILNGNTGYFVPSGYSFFTLRPTPEPNVIWNDSNGMGLVMNYVNGIFHAYVGIDGSALLTRLFNKESATITNLFDAFSIGEYWFRVNHDMFTLWFGERVYPPSVPAFQDDFTDWSGRLKVDWMGVNVPGTDFIYRNKGNSLFRDITSPGNVMDFPQLGYFIGSIKLLDFFFDIPITLDIGVDMSSTFQSQINGNFTNPGQSRIDGGLRISGHEVADFISFDLTYKLRGGDRTREDSYHEDIPGGMVQPDGVGQMAHVLGLALGFPRLISDLRISLGYTALFVTFEDHLFGPHSPTPPPEPYTMTKTGPMYNGFDIRLRYTGIPGLRLTLQSNVSFANADEPVFDDLGREIGRSVSVVNGGINLNRYQSQSWLALYNAFSARYNIGSQTNLNLHVLHRLGVLTENNSNETRGSLHANWGESEKVKSMFEATAYVSSRIVSNIWLEAGVSLWMENNRTQFGNYLAGGPTDHVTTSWSAGAVGLTFPVRMVVNW